MRIYCPGVRACVRACVFVVAETFAYACVCRQIGTGQFGCVWMAKAYGIEEDIEWTHVAVKVSYTMKSLCSVNQRVLSLPLGIRKNVSDRFYCLTALSVVHNGYSNTSFSFSTAHTCIVTVLCVCVCVCVYVCVCVCVSSLHTSAM